MPEFGSEQDVGLGMLHPVVWVSYLRGIFERLTNVLRVSAKRPNKEF